MNTSIRQEIGSSTSPKSAPEDRLESDGFSRIPPHSVFRAEDRAKEMAIESHDAIPAIYETIKSWIKGLGESTDFTGNPEIEAASWYRNLTQDLRLRLDLDLDHWGEGNAINLKDGPLVEFFARYSRVIGLKSDLTPEDGRSDPAPRDIRGEEAVSINVELGRLEQADPVWFADWERFVGSIDDTDPDED